MIPDFAKVGYDLLTVTLVKHRKNLASEQLEAEAKKGLERAEAGESPEMVMVETGMGLGYDAIIIAYEKDYSSYSKLIERIRTFEHLQATETQTFIFQLERQDSLPLVHLPDLCRTLVDHAKRDPMNYACGVFDSNVSDSDTTA